MIGKKLYFPKIALPLLSVYFCICVPGCTRKSETSPTLPVDAPAKSNLKAIFEEVSARSGLKFTHTSGGTGKLYYIENTPPGCAFFDYDNDGFQDIFLVQSGSSEPTASVKDRPFCALYHNNGDGTFTDVTAGSGFDHDLGYGQGVSIGDYDNDGFPDLLWTGYGGCHLFHNEKGTGKFTDVTAKMGLSQVTGYCTSAAFGDYDNDGKLDLYICRYSPWTWKNNIPCKDTIGIEYCTPEVYDPETHFLFHNEGSRFSDVSEKSGIRKSKGRGLSVGFVDYDNDGKQDIFVANDITPNMLWHNNGDGTFTNVAVSTGCAYDNEGKQMAGMGLAIADYDHSGNESFFVGNFTDLPNMLFKNVGGIFQDGSMAAGLAVPHLKYLTFGTEFMDYDSDGWCDLFVVNGHVQTHADQKYDNITYKERKQLFHNEQNGTFKEITDAGELGELNIPMVGRGLAIGDYDNDGHLDALVSNQNAAPQLYRNTINNGNHWVEFLTIGTKSNREGRHTRFSFTANGTKQLGTVRAGSSYLSHSDRRVYFGLGKTEKVESIEVRWPSGTLDKLTNVAADNIYVITEGKGITGKLSPAKKSTVP